MFICTCSKFNVKKFVSVKNTWINFFVSQHTVLMSAVKKKFSICVDTRMCVRSILYAISQTFSALYNWTNMTAPWGAQNWREKSTSVALILIVKEAYERKYLYMFRQTRVPNGFCYCVLLHSLPFTPNCWPVRLMWWLSSFLEFSWWGDDSHSLPGPVFATDLGATPDPGVPPLCAHGASRWDVDSRVPHHTHQFQ